jgi:Lrp/AsnC family leucine-responsive transcriptional regulator
LILEEQVKKMVDETDLKILKLLQNDGRETASKIAEKLNLTVPTITERIKKLQDSSVLKGFQAIIDPKSVSLDVSAVITVVASTSANYKVVIEKAVKCPEVIQCFATTGVGSLLLWVAAKNTHSLEELLRRIQNWPDVTRTETQIILSSYKSLPQLPL